MYRYIALINGQKVFFININTINFQPSNLLKTVNYQKKQFNSSYTIYYTSQKIIVIRYGEEGEIIDCNRNIMELFPELGQSITKRKNSFSHSEMSSPRSLEIT